MANEFGISLEDAQNELAWVVEDAHNFMVSEFQQDWETGEAYYAGECDLPREEGRSSVVKTEARDVIRAIMPNVMRVLLQSNKPVEYIPTNVRGAAFAEQQALWINHEFHASGGYDMLYAAALESMKLKSGPVKVFWEENAAPEHIFASGLTVEQVLMYEDDPDIVVEDVEERETPTGGLVYDIRATRYYENGKLVFEAFPIYEFFVQRDASNLNSIHGHRRSVSVSEAIAMGLEYDNWRELDNDDPRDNDAASADEKRRGYQTNQDDTPDVDIMNHEFLMTEAYCEYDMDGDGVPEKYVFYFGGTTYTYLHHEQIEDYCIALVSVDPQPFTVIGRSIVDITKQSQDNETSILRAIVDNAHQANNPRPAGDPQRVDFNDLMNNAIGAPIRTKGSPDIQYTDVPFTAGGLMPFLEWLEKDAETRVGVTKAAQGLDPDALQSTDKDAVLNTIQLSQGQIELMVRNIVNTGLIPLFRMALRLSVRHMDPNRVMRYRGAVVPVDLANFDPNLVAMPAVGLGTQSPEQKLQALNFVYNEQQKYMQQFGMDNPFTSLAQMYNTLEDMLEVGGLNNTGRYFNYIGVDEEAVIARMMSQKAAMDAEAQKQNMPLDPGKAHVMAESTRARVKIMETMTNRAIETQKLQYNALQHAEEMDFKRDDMSQERTIKLAELGKDYLNERIQQEQASTSAETRRPEGTGSSQTSGEQP